MENINRKRLLVIIETGKPQREDFWNNIFSQYYNIHLTYCDEKDGSQIRAVDCDAIIVDVDSVDYAVKLISEYTSIISLPVIAITDSSDKSVYACYEAGAHEVLRRYVDDGILRLRVDHIILNSISVCDADYKTMIESIVSVGIYVIAESDHRILYYNNRVKQVAPNIKLGDICHETWDGYCENCPLHIIGDKRYARTISFNDPFGDEVEISATRIVWKGRIPSFLIRVYPRLNVFKTSENINAYTESGNGKYEIDSSFHVVSYSNNAKQRYSKLEEGAFCYECVMNRTEQCTNCPIITKTDEGAIVNVEPVKRGDNTNYILRFKLDSLPSTFYDIEKEKTNVQNTDELGNYGIPAHFCKGKTNLPVTHDEVSGALTRSGFIAQMEQMRKEGVNLNNFTILFLNIDRFKAINELFTIQGGDDLLRHTYNILMNCELEPLICSRFESDHFVALFETKNLNKVNLKKMQDIQWSYNGKTIRVHTRSGLYHIENNRMSISGMIDRAKLAKQYIMDEHTKPFEMYNKDMRNEYIFGAEVGATYNKAIEEHQFKVYFQPVVDAYTGKIVSAEALVRWNHPEKGIISPALFIPVLEQQGDISVLDEYINDEVYRFLRTRQDNHQFFVPVSVNLSWMDFNEENFIDKIVERSEQGLLPEGTLRYELTETAYTALKKNNAVALNSLRKCGSKVLLDDFGSGISSLGMIRDYDFDILKLDMSFIRQIGVNEKIPAIIESMIAMCHKLELQVVAEGVETKEQADYLKQAGCDYIQGYFYSKPLSKEDFIKLLDEHEKK